MNIWTSFENNYEIRHLISRDSVSSTYTARRKSDNKIVAAREFLLFSLGPAERDAVDEEISILQRIVHPNVPAYKEIRFSEDSRVLYVITSHVQSEPLSQFIRATRKQNTHVEERVVWGIIAELVDLLHFVLLPQKLNFTDDDQIDFLSLDPHDIMLDRDMHISVRSFKFVKDAERKLKDSKPSSLSEKASLYECCIPGASINSVEQRTLYIIGLLIYELCLLAPYNYYSPIGPWPSCPANQIFFPLHSLELCGLCKRLLDVTQAPRITISDLIDIPQIREVHPLFAAEDMDKLNQQTELISSRYNTEMESFSSRAFSYLSILKQSSLQKTFSNDDVMLKGADRGSIDLHEILTAPITVPEGVEGSVTQALNRPASPSRILGDQGPGLAISSPVNSVIEQMPSTSRHVNIESPSIPISPVNHKSLPEYLTRYPFISRPTYEIVEEHTDLMKAVISGDFDLACNLIEKETCYMLPTGETALYYSLLHRNYQLADLLLPHEGLLVNDDMFSEAVIKNQEGPFSYNQNKTPLMNAALANDLIGVYSLIPYYARIQDNCGKTALMHALEHGNSAAACLLADSEYGLLDAQGLYASFFSILNSNPIAFQFLHIKESGLLKGDGFTPLMIAAALNDEAGVTSHLHRYKAIRTKKGLTATMIAVHMKYDTQTILERLSEVEAGIRDEKGQTALVYAIRTKNEAAMKILTKSEAEITDPYGKTPLIYAAIANYPQAIVIHQNQARKTDTSGKTALMHAIESNNISTAAMLASLESGIQDIEGETALMKAITHGLPAIARILIPSESGHVDASGNFATKLALLRGDSDLVQLLLPHEINLLRKEGFTDLMLTVATLDGNIHADCLLHYKGQQTKTGLSALMIATLTNNQRAVPLLIDEYELADDSGQKAIDYARKLNNSAIVRLLTDFTDTEPSLQEQSPFKLPQPLGETQTHRSSFLTIGARNSIEDNIPEITSKNTDNNYVYHSINEQLSQLTTATPQALVAPNPTTPREGILQSLPTSTEFLQTVPTSLVPRSANTSTLSNGSVGNKSFNSLRRTIQMDRKYDGYEPDVRRNSTRLPKRPISAVPTKPIPAVKPWGITDVDFTSLSLDADSFSVELLDNNRSASPIINLPDIPCNEFLSEDTYNVKPQANTTFHTTARNPLLVAVLANDLNSLSKCLNYARETFGKSKKTALIVAADRGSTEIVRMLEPYEAGMKTSFGWTALMRAALHNHVDCASILIPKEAGMLNHKSLSALMIATELGYIEVASRLAKPEAGLRNASGYTALMLAAKRGYADLVEILAPYEANYTRSNGVTALMYAIQNRHTSCVRILSEYEAGMRLANGWTSLMMAAQNGFLDAVELLKKFEGKMQNINGSTALMLAAQNRRLAAVRLLADTEASITNGQGATALMMAAENGSVLICQILEPYERGIITKSGSTALMFAARAGHLDVVSLFLNTEAGKQTGTGHTALMLAAKAGLVDVCSLLLKRECRLCTSDNTTALMLAARAGNLKVVELLAPFEAGMRRRDGVTARILAETKGHVSCKQLLERFEP